MDMFPFSNIINSSESFLFFLDDCLCFLFRMFHLTYFVILRIWVFFSFFFASFLICRCTIPVLSVNIVYY